MRKAAPSVLVKVYLATVVAILWLIFSHSEAILTYLQCETPNYSPSNSEKTLWEHTSDDFQKIEREGIPVFIDKKQIGVLYRPSMKLVLRQMDGLETTVWQYSQDYSSMLKITQSQDDETLNVYVETQFMGPIEKFVTLYDISSGKSQEFLVSCGFE